MSPGRSTGHDHVLAELLDSWVRDGAVAGAVALVDRGTGEPEVAVTGSTALESGRPMARDTLFRFASITKPLTSAAALTFVDDGTLALDDPVSRWVPELTDLRVLREPGASPADTVPAERGLTVEDLLSSRSGWGFPSTSEGPWVQALSRLQTGLEITVPAAPDGWIADLARLPLRAQPGSLWLYNTSYDVLGVLLGRITGSGFPDVLHERLLAPLGMRDTAFHALEQDRFCAAYRREESGLALVDAPDGRWSREPAFPSGAGGTVGTVDDWYRFARELLAGQGRVLSRESVRRMTTDVLSGDQAREADLFLDGEGGWGFGGSVHPVTGRYGWVGGTGTSAHVVPATGQVGILLTQTTMDSPVPPVFLHQFWDYAF